MVANLVLGLRGASAITLIAAVLVLGGALAAGHRHRVHDAVVLKMLGATRGRLIAAYALEYLLIGLRDRLFGVAAGSAAAWFIVDPGDEPVVRLAAGTGVRGGRRRHRGRRSLLGLVGTFRGARPEAGAGAAQPLNCSGAAIAACLGHIAACKAVNGLRSSLSGYGIVDALTIRTQHLARGSLPH